MSIQGRGADLGVTGLFEERKEANGTACLSGQWMRAAQKVSELLAAPTTSKENKALAAARGMAARTQEKPELEAGASREARSWISGTTEARSLKRDPHAHTTQLCSP